MQSQLIDVRKLVIASPSNKYQSAKVYNYPYAPIHLYLFFEKSSLKNQVRRTGFFTCRNQFRNRFLQATLKSLINEHARLRVILSTNPSSKVKLFVKRTRVLQIGTKL